MSGYPEPHPPTPTRVEHGFKRMKGAEEAAATEAFSESRNPVSASNGETSFTPHRPRRESLAAANE